MNNPRERIRLRRVAVRAEIFKQNYEELLCDRGLKPLVETEGLDAKHESPGAGTAIAQGSRP